MFSTKYSASNQANLHRGRGVSPVQHFFYQISTIAFFALKKKRIWVIFRSVASVHYLGKWIVFRVVTNTVKWRDTIRIRNVQGAYGSGELPTALLLLIAISWYEALKILSESPNTIEKYNWKIMFSQCRYQIRNYPKSKTV